MLYYAKKNKSYNIPLNETFTLQEQGTSGGSWGFKSSKFGQSFPLSFRQTCKNNKLIGAKDAQNAIGKPYKRVLVNVQDYKKNS